MRAGPLGTLQRGVLNLRANRELILLSWFGQGLVVVLSLVSLLPFYLVLDIDAPGEWSTLDEYLVWATGTTERVLEQLTTPSFWLAALASTAVLLAVLFVASFFRAGAFGVLAAGELCSPPGANRVGGFRVYRWGAFQAAAGARLWKYFWLLNLILCLWLLWAFAGSLAALATGLAFGGAGLGAGLALGCASLLPLAFGVVLLTFWGWLAQAELGLRDCSVWEALGAGLRNVLRRFGSMLILFIVLAVLTIGSTFVFLLLSLTAEAGLASFDTVRSVLWWGLQALQWLVGAIIHLAFAATLVAVARQETDLSVTAEEE